LEDRGAVGGLQSWDKKEVFITGSVTGCPCAAITE
jgi:hypothetical protein